MQPAVREVVQYFTLPASAATAGDFLAESRSFPWCVPPDRGAPKSSTYCTSPTTGKTMWAGTLALVEARAVPATRPRMTARKRIPRAVVRLRRIEPGSRPKRRRLAGEPGRSRSLESGAVKIVVCVKYVPEGTKRIDPATKRLDRSGEGALNAFDANAVEEALRLKE